MRPILSSRPQRPFCFSGPLSMAIVLTLLCMSNTHVFAQKGTVKNIDPAKVVKLGTCTECHKNEVAAWEKSKHHGSLDKIKAGANLAKYAGALGIPVGDVMKNSDCTQCHGTPSNAGGAVAAIGGVSCQSCHGAAKGWLDNHKTLKNAAPEARGAIHKKCDGAGAIRSNNLYAIAKNCFECHVVRNQDLVNAGHPGSNKVELVTWSAGEVRHNFQIDQTKNALAATLWMKNTGKTAKERRRLKYVVGLLVDAEITTTNLGKVPKGKGKTPFAKANAKRLKSTVKALKAVVKALDGNVPKPIDDGYELVGFKISSINFKSMDEAKEAAAGVAEAAEAAAKLDPADLAALDKLIEKECDKPQGKALSP